MSFSNWGYKGTKNILRMQKKIEKKEKLPTTRLLFQQRNSPTPYYI